MIIMGIDPGINNTGWAIIKKNINKLEYVASGFIKTKASDKLYLRLAFIVSELRKVIELYNPEIAGLEEIFLNKNPSSSLKLAHARGAIMSVLGSSNIQVLEFSARSVKKNIVGTGAAEKEQVMHMVKLIFGSSSIKSSDESDALAIAYSASL